LKKISPNKPSTGARQADCRLLPAKPLGDFCQNDKVACQNGIAGIFASFNFLNYRMWHNMARY